MESESIYAVILAAGSSARLGFPKQLLPYQGKTLLAQVVQNILESRIERIFLVLGYQAGAIKKRLRVQKKNKRLRILLNTNFEKGKATSIRTALASIPKNTQAVMFVLGDQPFIRADLIHKLLSSFHQDKPLLCFPVYKNRRGHPIIFHRKLFPALLRLKGDKGGAELIRKYWAKAAKVRLTSWKSQLEVDTWSDYQKILKHLQAK